MQRRIEREIRKQKRRKTAFEAAGLTEDATAANIKLRRLNQKYKEFSKAAGLPEQRDRIKVLYTQKEQVENSLKHDILKENGHYLHQITEESIQNVSLVKPNDFSKTQAQKLQDAHKTLLQDLMKKPIGTEGCFLYSSDMSKRISYAVGEDDGQSVSIPRFSVPHIAIHNHPDNNLFSVTDLTTFILNEQMECITAVGNSGNVFLLKKTGKYDGFMFWKILDDALPELDEMVKQKDIDGYIDIIRRILLRGDEYGVEFIEG